MSNNGTSQHIVETYDYRTPEGVLAYQVVRKADPKDFLQRHPCPDKGDDWFWNMGGDPTKCPCPKIGRLPYCLPELLAADPGTTVYTVEGEKDVDRARREGLVATCNSGGAKKWEDHYAAWLQGRNVVVVPDNDQDGHDHGQQVAQLLNGRVKSVRVLDLPGLTKKGADLTDWLDQGGTVDELARLADGCEEWEPEPGNSVYSGDSVYGWEAPQPFAVVDVPSFPVDAFPEELAKYITQESDAKQVPVDLPACLVLGATATAVAGKVRVSLTGDWEEPLNNFFVVVLPSGERKSPAVREIFSPLEDYEKALVIEKTPMVLSAQTERDILDKRLQGMKTEAAKAGAENRLSAEADARSLAIELANMQVPALPRLLADDATPEAVAGLLSEHSGRMAIVSTEGGIFEIIGGRYSDKVPNLDVYLKGYSGDPIRVDRRSRAPEFIPDPCLTVVITVQPDVIRDLADNHSFRGRGFLARWNYSIPNSKVGYRNVNAPTVHSEVKANWSSALSAVLRLPYPADGHTPLLHLSAGAMDLFQAFRRAVELDLRPGEDLDDIADWGNKLPGGVARFAGLLHVLQYAGQCNPWEVLISPETMAGAILVGNYFKEHAKAAFAAMGADLRMASAKRVWSAIVRKEWSKFSVRDLYQLMRRSFKTVPELEKTLGLLIELNYIRDMKVLRQEGPGQSPSPRYEVNPLVRTQNTHGTPNSDDSESF